MKLKGDGGHSAVLHTLPLAGSLNTWICGVAFGYAQISPCSETSHILKMLCKIRLVLHSFMAC